MKLLRAKHAAIEAEIEQVILDLGRDVDLDRLASLVARKLGVDFDICREIATTRGLGARRGPVPDEARISPGKIPSHLLRGRFLKRGALTAGKNSTTHDTHFGRWPIVSGPCKRTVTSMLGSRPRLPFADLNEISSFLGLATESAPEAFEHESAEDGSDGARPLIERARAQGGESLPGELRTELERKSGHDLGGIRVNTGAAAAAAAAALDARAYAFGSQVNFAAGEYDPASDDGRDLIAHEVAHSIQQASAEQSANRREPIFGEATAPLVFSSPAQETEADAFAAAVGTHLTAPALSQSPTMHIARKGKGKGSKSKRNRVLVPTNPFRSTSGVSFAEIAAVAAGKADEKALGTEWVSSLHSRARQDIERGFSLESQDKEFGKRIKKDKELRVKAKAHEKELRAREKRAIKEAKDLGEKVGNRKQRRSALDADDSYRQDTANSTAEYERDRATTVASRRAEFDGGDVRDEVSESIIELPDKMTREEARLLARINFVDWGVGILGSEAAAKAHFSAVKPVAGFGGLLLHADAGEALKDASKLFSEKFPGQQMVRTSGGFSIRNRHQGRHSRGKQGHPLGIAIDFKAYENPHQTDPQKAFLLRRFGGQNADGSGGTNRMDIPGATKKAMRMAKEMETTGKLSAESERDLEKVKKAHNAMAETSERFKKQLASTRPALQVVRESYIEVVGPAMSKVKALNKRIKKLKPKAKGAIKKKRQAEYRELRDARVESELAAAKGEDRKMSKKQARRKIDGDPDMKELKKASKVVTDAMIEAHESVASLAEERSKSEAQIAVQEVALKKAMKTTFKPWIEELAKDVKSLGASLPPNLVANPPSRGQVSGARAALKRVAGAAASVRKAKKKPGKSADKARAKLAKRIGDLLAEFSDVFGTHAIDDDTDLIALYEKLEKLPGPLGEISARNEIVQDLETDIDFVFGGNSGAYKKTVVDPSIMQLLEDGFIRHDPVAPAGADGEAKKTGTRVETFNAEFTAIMMPFGYTPGGAWNSSVDTMHYDYRPGYAKLTGGGMKSVKYGPKGVDGKSRKK